MSEKYDLKILHSGTDCGDFCLYQTYDGQMEDIRSLVWFSKTAHSKAKPPIYESGNLMPDTAFFGAQEIDED